jgi:fatty-acyl-CoA synthase
VAAGLANRGVQPNARVAVATADLRSQVTAIAGAWIAGACVVVLPPLDPSVKQSVDQIAWRTGFADVACLVTDALVPDDAPLPAVVSPEQLAQDGRRLAGDDRPGDDVDVDAPALLQFTSGSTGDPRAIVVTHRMVATNHAAIFDGGGLAHDDVYASWLPLHHDMGLIGFFALQFCEGLDLVLMDTARFARAPRSWMEMLDRWRATVTGGPNFAYEIAARGLRPSSHDLSCVKRTFNGSEPVSPKVARAFTAAGAANGLRPQSMFCVYGMAEATLAVTFPELDSGLTTHHLQAGAGSDDEPTVTERACLGRPVDGVELVVSGTEGQPESIGEIVIRGASVTTGLFDGSRVRPARSDGWLHTGDLGYLTADGEVVICGRAKDLIIVAGRNIFAEEVERHLGAAGIRAGSAVAFGVERQDREEKVVVAVEAPPRRAQEIRDVVTTTVRAATGLTPDVVLVPRHSLPKTTSGKVRRRDLKHQFLSGVLETL